MRRLLLVIMALSVLGASAAVSYAALTRSDPRIVGTDLRTLGSPTAHKAAAGDVFVSTRFATPAIAHTVSHGKAKLALSIAKCPAGWLAVGGGWTSRDYDSPAHLYGGTSDPLDITSSTTTDAGRNWLVAARDTARHGAWEFQAVVMCVTQK